MKYFCVNNVLREIFVVDISRSYLQTNVKNKKLTTTCDIFMSHFMKLTGSLIKIMYKFMFCRHLTHNVI